MKVFIKRKTDLEVISYTIVTFFFLLYVVVWAHIALVRYYSLHALIFDLGGSMESMWQVYHSNITLSGINYYFVTNGIRLILSPISLLDNYPFILIVQTIFIAAPSFFIFQISKLKKNGLAFSIALAGIYLIYPPLAGLNWYDFHFQTFFPFFFILGYLLYLKGNWILASILLFISGLVRYPFSIFPILFCLLEISSFLIHRKKKENKIEYKMPWAIFILLIALIILTIFSFIINRGITGILVISHVNSKSSDIFSNLSSNIDYKIFTVLLLLTPVFFLPIFSPKWYLFYLPFFALMLFSGNPVYFYPSLFRLQYGSLIIPFIFLGSIDGFNSIRSDNEFFERDRPKHELLYHSNNLKRKDLKIVSTMVITSILLATVLMPYGPLHGSSNVGMDLSQDNINMTIFREVEALTKLIPENASSVFLQNNLPEGLPRPLISGDQIFVPGTSVYFNLSAQYTNGTWFKLNPTYILDDPFYGNSGQFLSECPYPYNYSMYEFVHYFEGDGYGVLAEASGMVLLEKDYSGPLIYYVPYYNYFPASRLTPFGPGVFVSSKIVINNALNQSDFDSQGFVGPYTVLSPGYYNITFAMSTTSLSVNNSINLVVSGEVGKILFGERKITGNNFKEDNSLQKFTIEIYVNNTYANVEFRGTNPHWEGYLNLTGVYVNQISPPI